MNIQPPPFNIARRRYIEGSELILRPEVEGVFTLRARKADGRIVRERTFKNLILNQGMDRLAQATSVFSVCQVGTGSTAPAITQTQLAAYLANSGTTSNGSMTRGGAPDYINTWTCVYLFTLGAVVGNLTEVGVGWAGTGTTLWSRALILDGGGNPTTFTVLADEQLEVTYQINIYPPVTDVTTTQNINGSPVDVIVRAYNVTGGGFGLLQYNYGIVNASQQGAQVYSGNKIAITSSGSPSGALGSAMGSDSTYVSGNYYRDASWSWSVSQGNGSIRTAIFQWKMAAFQVEYQTPIVKTNTQTLVLPARLTWARH